MLLNMVMFKVTICDIGKMNINMTDKIEKRRAANCVYHIEAYKPFLYRTVRLIIRSHREEA